jgi:predicted dehydrogenase
MRAPFDNWRITVAHRSARTIQVGLGGYGSSFYLDHILGDGCPEIELIGAVDPMAGRSPHYEELTHRGIPIHPSLDECLAALPQSELVIIASPFHYHRDQVVTAARHGKAILCEKPLCPSGDEAQAMLAAQQKYAVPVAIGYQWSFSRAIGRLKADILARRFGRARTMKALTLWPRSPDYYQRNDWAGRIRADDGTLIIDSPLANATAHYLHNLFFLLGDAPDRAAQPVQLRGEAYRAHAIENFDTAALHATTDAGADVFFFTTHTGEGPSATEFELIFETAVVTFRNGQIVARCHDGRSVAYGDPEEDPVGKVRQSARMALEGLAPPCSIATAIPHVLACDAMQQSVGTPVPFPDAWIRRSPERVLVPQLNQRLSECYRRECLPSDLGLPWARPGGTVSIRQPRVRSSPGSE